MSTLQWIPLDQIKANTYQPRRNFEDSSIEDLANSIRENGLIQPVTVRETYFGYQLIAGERRFRACQLLGWEKIQCIIVDASEVESAKLALIENVQREDLSAIEEAAGYREILDLTGMTQIELAEQVGKSQSAIANKLRLLNLDEKVQEALRTGQISERHGRALLELDGKGQRKALKKILKDDLTVKELESYLRRSAVAKKPEKLMQCFGVSTRLVINSVRSNFRKIAQLTDNVSMTEEDRDDCYVMTITVKK